MEIEDLALLYFWFLYFSLFHIVVWCQEDTVYSSLSLAPQPPAAGLSLFFGRGDWIGSVCNLSYRV